MTQEEGKAAFMDWCATRPEIVRKNAEMLPPWKSYRLKSTGQNAQPIAYAEDGTVRANCWQEWCPELTAVQVFGLDPNDFEIMETTPQ